MDLFLRRVGEREEDAIVDGDGAGEECGSGGGGDTYSLCGARKGGAGRFAPQRIGVPGNDRDTGGGGSTGTRCAEASIANEDLAQAAIGGPCRSGRIFRRGHGEKRDEPAGGADGREKIIVARERTGFVNGD